LTGSIYLQEFDKEFKSEDALYQLEYEVEKAYVDRNIEEGERKKIFKALINEVSDQAIQGSLSFKNELKNLILKELDKKIFSYISRIQRFKKLFLSLNGMEKLTNHIKMII